MPGEIYLIKKQHHQQQPWVISSEFIIKYAMNDLVNR
jgi:hypothetical protein